MDQGRAGGVGACMQVTVTVLAGDSRGQDVRVRCSPDAPVAALLRALAAAGICAGATGHLHVGEHRLDPARTVGATVLQGCVLRLAPLPQTPAALRELRVVGGLSAGSAHPLPAGTTVLGRGPRAGLGLDDPRVSRAHARVVVDSRGVTVTDLGSTNGSALDGRPLPVAATRPWSPGARLRVGDTVLQLAHPDAPGPSAPALGGRVPVTAPPRLRSPAPQAEVRIPEAPPAPRRPRLPLAAAVAPLLVGVAAALVLRSPTFLLFALLSPVVVLAGAASDRGHARRDDRTARREHDAGVRVAQAAIAAALRAEAAHRHRVDLDCASLRTLARNRDGRLWERRSGDDDVLRVRVGTADLPSSVRVVGGPPVTCPAVPVTVDLRSAGGLGIAGSREDTLALARAVVTSAAALHAPSVLEIVVLHSSGTDDWGWTRWLPHVRQERGAPSAERLAGLMRSLGSGGGTLPPTRPRALVVVDDRRLRDRSELATLAALGPTAGVHLLCLAPHRGELPPACSAVLADGGAGQGWVLHQDGARRTVGICPDGVTGAWAEETARLLAPLVLTGEDADAGLPGDLAWRDLADLGLTGGPGDAATVMRRWSRASPAPAFTLGVSSDGPVTVDLRRDGPHCLVAGTTGSGKSELLQTMVAGLALTNPPEALQLVLVDYKGGAAFGSCAGLPHTAGLVTDLDAAATRRALASLAAELRRREAALSRAGVPDIDAHERQRATAGPEGRALEALPRLVIVVDEFATLAEELPEFVRGLVAVAQRGRSLGVHLVLATQRPEGSVSQDIRANTALRFCLAVARDAESRDVLDAPDAARLGRHLPGRGYLRRGAEGLVLFQTARVTVPPPTPEAEQALTVQAVSAGAPTDDVTPPAPPADGPTDLDLVVAACQDAARARAVPLPARPWLPPLPDRCLLSELVVDLPHVPGDPGGQVAPVLPDLLTAPPGRPDDSASVRVGAVPFALQDVPSEQRRRVLSLDLGGHLAVIGGPRSGRTTTLVTIAGAAAQALPPDRLHVVGLDFGGTALSALEELPHCGALVTGDEPDRLARLVAALTREVARRRAVLGDRHASSGAPAEPHLLVLLDQWDGFVATHADVDAGRLVDGVTRVLREGPAVGVTAVVSADRTALVGRVAGLLPRRLLLRLPDPGDYATAGIAVRDVPADLPPGRGVHDDGLLTQVALLDADAVPDPRATLARVAAVWPAPQTAAGEPLRVDPLPTRVTVSAVEGLRRAPRPGQRVLTVGVGGDRLGPVDVDLDESGPVLVVAGPPRSGRSTALCTLVRSHLDGAVRTGPPPQVVVVAPRRSPLCGLTVPGVRVTVVAEPGDALLLERLLAAPCLLVVDDAELVADTALAPVLDAAVSSARDTGTVVLAAGTTTALLTAYRGWVVEARRGRSGLLLTPESAADGELFGCRLPRSTGQEQAPPGRGLLVVRGAPCPVQVATADGSLRPATRPGTRPEAGTHARGGGMRDVA